ncbi:ABC transporter permease, partial [Leucobacter sp. M11]|uniref:ABC transporter permease n=1 Tax=Leucobacter sp. M11 TaxID=2993565 RepID=UPI002D80940E
MSLTTVPRNPTRTLTALLSAGTITLLLTALPIALAGAEPLGAFRRYFVTPVTTPQGIAELLLAATPLLFTGLAAMIAFRVGYYNIGIEGQFLAGAITASVFALAFPELPGWLALPLGLMAGICGGVLWAAVPLWLKLRARIDEVVSTLLLNPVALLLLQGLLNGPYRNSETGFPDSDSFGAGYLLGPLIPGSRVHWGAALAVGLIVLAGLTIALTPLGIRARAVGQAPAAATFSGISVPRMQAWSALISGGLAGLGGASQVFGVNHQLTASFAVGYGYTGIVVATLGGLSAVGLFLAACLLGSIAVGALSASVSLGVPAQMGTVVTSTLLLAVVGSL